MRKGTVALSQEKVVVQVLSKTPLIYVLIIEPSYVQAT